MAWAAVNAPGPAARQSQQVPNLGHSTVRHLADALPPGGSGSAWVCLASVQALARPAGLTIILTHDADNLLTASSSWCCSSTGGHQSPAGTVICMFWIGNCNPFPIPNAKLRPTWFAPSQECFCSSEWSFPFVRSRGCQVQRASKLFCQVQRASGQPGCLPTWSALVGLRSSCWLQTPKYLKHLVLSINLKEWGTRARAWSFPKFS